MRRFEDKFFKVRRQNPSKGLIDQYEARARKLDLDLERDTARIASWAHARGLKQEAYQEFRALLMARSEPLQFDPSGSIVLGAATIPEELSKTFRNESILINDSRYLRDAFLSLVPTIQDVHEATSERLRVRSERSADEAERILAITLAELPLLEAECGGRPGKRMDVFVFKERPSYEAYCESAGYASHRVAAGLADRRRNVAVVCGESGDTQEIFAIALHEVAHLFQFGVSPSAMPSWYKEGFAEAFGGRGTFTWDGKKLAIGGSLERADIEPLRDERNFIPLAVLLSSDAHEIMTTDKKKAERFYAESWALVRFLSSGAKEATRSAFERWETMCLGAAVGAQANRQGNPTPSEAAALFDQVVGKDLVSLELEFRAFLLKL